MKKILNTFEKLRAQLEEEIDKRTQKFDNASEKWQESEKGENFQNLTDFLQEKLDEILDWTSEIEEQLNQ